MGSDARQAERLVGKQRKKAVVNYVVTVEDTGHILFGVSADRTVPQASFSFSRGFGIVPGRENHAWSNFHHHPTETI